MDLEEPIGVVVGPRGFCLMCARRLMRSVAVGVSVVPGLGWRSRARIALVSRHPTAVAFPFGLLAGCCEGTVNVSGPMLLIFFLPGGLMKVFSRSGTP